MDYIAETMLYKQTLFFIAASLTAVVHGLPSPSTDTGLKVTRQYEVEGGTLTWYEDSTPAKRSFDTVDINRRCGTNAVKCSGSHTAPSSVCFGLTAALAGPQDSGTVTRNPRSICFKATGQSVNGECCVSWANNVSGAVDGDFVNAVMAVNNQCVDSSTAQVSGLMRDTIIGSTCTTVCLSNRADGCK
jgi:hypothetical protein